VQDIARDEGWSQAHARQVIEAGPYLADEAVAAGLVDGALDRYELDAPLEALQGAALPRLEAIEPRAPRDWGGARRIGVVVVDGTLVDGRNQDIPFVGIHTSGGQTIVEAIEGLAADPSIGAIVLRVDSPGGSVLASDQIWRALRRARRRKPVIASMGAVAASGGYYVASAADEIWADPATITGSIGIFFGKVDFSALAERLGVRIEHLRRGPHAGAESLFRPFTPVERALLVEKVRRWYRLFLRRVATGRGLPVARVHELGQGRVYSGDRALRLGLVDRLGGFDSALSRARRLARLSDEAAVILLPRRPEHLLEYVLGQGPGAQLALGALDEEGPAAQGRSAPTLLPLELRRAAELAMVLGHTREGIPMALMPAYLESE
ncbi:MAG: signal peptide peptidase SppA, partial [Myxococcales bacterium]|nr:signal peptide peptidase SppA [Myxococcales bacterium]